MPDLQATVSVKSKVGVIQGVSVSGERQGANVGGVVDNISIQASISSKNLISSISKGGKMINREVRINQAGIAGSPYTALKEAIGGGRTVFTVDDEVYVSGTLTIELGGNKLALGNATQEASEVDPSAGTFKINIGVDVGENLIVTYQVVT